jgi:hypothetical protein
MTVELKEGVFQSRSIAALQSARYYRGSDASFAAAARYRSGQGSGDADGSAVVENLG